MKNHHRAEGRRSGRWTSLSGCLALAGIVLATGCTSETSSGGPGGAGAGTSSAGSTTTGEGTGGAMSTSSASTGVGGGTGGAMSTSSTGTGGACGAGETECLAGCANLATDPASCGMCGHACYAGATCNAGVCAQIACAGTLGFPGPPMIQVPMSYAQVGFPGLLAEGDVNGDGKLDLIVATQSPGGLTVVLNLGNGTFGPPITVSKTWSPAAVLTGDLNGDGKLDLVVMDTKVNILFGQGNGTFAAAVQYSVGSGTSIAMGDLNGDGKPDLAMTALGETQVLLNQGNGAFAAPVSYAAATYIPGMGYGPTGGLYPQVVALGDMNGDGKLDLVVGHQGYYADAVQGQVRDPVSIFLNQGNGTFALVGEYDAGAAPQKITLGDFNADGKLDLATVNPYTSSLNVLLNQGSGAFADPVSYALAAAADKLAVGDLNGDGKPDIVAKGTGASLLFNQGNGTFSAGVSLGVGQSPSAVAVVDVSGDGKADIIVTNQLSSEVSVLLNLGSGIFAAPVKYSVAMSPTSIRVGDLDGDGKLDLVLGVEEGNAGANTLSILLNAGGGVFGAAILYKTAYPPGAIALGDVDGDGKLDIAYAGFDVNPALASHAGVLLNQGNGAFVASPTTYAMPDGSRTIELGDLNGDGRPDLIVGTIHGLVSVLPNQGNGTFGAALDYSGRSYVIATGDLDGDGALDLATAGDDVVVLLNRCLP